MRSAISTSLMTLQLICPQKSYFRPVWWACARTPRVTTSLQILSLAQWCRRRVKNARGNSTNRIVGRKTGQRKICIISKYFQSFRHFVFWTRPIYTAAVSTLLAMIQTYLSKCCEPCCFVTLTFKTSSFWCRFLSLYFMLYMTGLPLWHSKEEHNTVNMLCSLKKLSHYNKFLPPHNGHLFTRATFFCPQGGPLWNGSTVHKLYKILMY